MSPTYLVPLFLSLFLAACAQAAPAEPYSQVPATPTNPPKAATVFCTQEVKTCPNGVAVARDPAKNCEFAACSITDPAMSYTTLPLTDLPKATLTDAKVPQLRAPAVNDLVAKISTTKGDIWLRLFETEAPKTVENFAGLASKGYYNGIIFHRVIQDFMIQTGDPTGTGRGGESIYGKKFNDEIVPSLHHLEGTVSMANSGKNTNGSQFFIVQNKAGTGFLDGGYSIFGQVFSGQDVVDAIATTKTGTNDKPVEQISMQAVSVYRVK